MSPKKGSARSLLAWAGLWCIALPWLPTFALAQPDKLAGSWQIFNEQFVKLPRTATIAAAGPQIILDNGSGLTGPAELRGNAIVLLGLLNGTVSANGNQIAWSNGYRWARQTAPESIDLTGEWIAFDEGGNRSPNMATITQQGMALTLNNGVGSVAAGRLAGGKVDAPNWGVTGGIGVDWKSISWSNRTRWSRIWAHGRQISFENAGAFVAVMQVTYVPAGTRLEQAMSSGPLAPGRSKAITVPETTPNTTITVRISIANPTGPSRIAHTAMLSGDEDFPKQCFKALGTVFNPQLGIC